MQELKARLLVGSLFITFLCLAIYLMPHPSFRLPFTALTTLLGSACLYEFYSLAKAKGDSPLKALGILTFTLAMFGLYYYMEGFIRVNFFPALLFASLAAGFLLRIKKINNALHDLSSTFFGLLYIWIGFSSFLLISYHLPTIYDDAPRFWVIFLFITAKASDSFAYFSGNLFGKTPLCATISPKKTIEGLIGGLIGSLASVYLLTLFIPPPLSFLPLSFITLLTTLSAALGDLFESLLKRDANIKDSAEIPGLGGFLDICDSLLTASPTLYFVLSFFF